MRKNQSQTVSNTGCKMATPREFSSDTELAAVIGISPKTLRKWRLVNVGPPYRKIGNSVRYRRSDFEQWLSGCPKGGEQPEKAA